MNASIAIRPHGLPSRLMALVREVPPVPRAICIAVLVCGVVAIAAKQGGWLRPSHEAASPGRSGLSPVRPERGLVADAPANPARRRCETCGVVESIRRVPASGDSPATYEFTVRLRDGTARTSSDPGTSNWRAGDRVMLIGGDAAND